MGINTALLARSSASHRIVECKMCCKDGLHWKEADEGFRLADHSGLLHKCDPARMQRYMAEDLDDVSSDRGAQ